MSVSDDRVSDLPALVTRREAILRVTALLGGVALVGGSALLNGCRYDATPNTDAPFTDDEIAFLDEVAETILPETSTPGAKAAKVGAFMALMVRDSYYPSDRKVFRDGITAINDASRKAYGVEFMKLTPEQRLAVLDPIDKDQKAYMDAKERASRTKALAYLSDQRQEAAPGSDVGAATAVTEEQPTHYFRMMKELALLGYFTSEIGMLQAQRYVEAPGRYDPCVPYKAGEKAWAPHA